MAARNTADLLVIRAGWKASGSAIPKLSDVADSRFDLDEERLHATVRGSEYDGGKLASPPNVAVIGTPRRLAALGTEELKRSIYGS